MSITRWRESCEYTKDHTLLLVWQERKTGTHKKMLEKLEKVLPRL